MELRKNGFICFSLVLFQICTAFLMFSGLTNLGAASRYPFLRYGTVLLGIGALWIAVQLLSGASARLNLPGRLDKTYILAVKWIFAGAALSAGAYARVWAIGFLPVQPSSDYQTYFTVAKMLADGTLLRDGAGLCDYISHFSRASSSPPGCSISAAPRPLRKTLRCFS